MTDRENMLRAIRFERPDYIPMRFHLNAACWHHYPQDALQELQASHPLLFPNFQPQPLPIVPAYGPNARADQPFVDAWGCRWETTDNGITGAVTQHPLADWEVLDAYQPPDPASTDGVHALDWSRIQQRTRQAQADGHFTSGGLTHGHTFLRLCDLRGYQNLLFDMADSEARLQSLLDMVEAFNLAIVQRYLDLDVDMMSYPEDLGMQRGPMLSPSHFRRYIKPLYQRYMAPARERGMIVHMHSDGDIRQLVDELIDGGVEVINLQDLVNGIDWIAERFAGRTCVDLDIDRQEVTRFGTPERIDALIREEVTRIGRPEGGLMMIFGLYPGTPLENVKALMDAMERYATHFA